MVAICISRIRSVRCALSSLWTQNPNPKGSKQKHGYYRNDINHLHLKKSLNGQSDRNARLPAGLNPAQLGSANDAWYFSKMRRFRCSCSWKSGDADIDLFTCPRIPCVQPSHLVCCAWLQKNWYIACVELILTWLSWVTLLYAGDNDERDWIIGQWRARDLDLPHAR